MESISSPSGSTSRLSLNSPDLPSLSTYTLVPGLPTPGRSILLRPPIAVIRGTGILTCFPSVTHRMPHLRGRLTLRGIALRRKPWVFGVKDSHLDYRYSCQHSHFRYLHRSSRYGFNGLRNALLPCLAASISSVHTLSPVIFSAQDHSTSELLRFL